jgi:hypothetical protein
MPLQACAYSPSVTAEESPLDANRTRRHPPPIGGGGGQGFAPPLPSSPRQLTGPLVCSRREISSPTTLKPGGNPVLIPLITSNTTQITDLFVPVPLLRTGFLLVCCSPKPCSWTRLRHQTGPPTPIMCPFPVILAVTPDPHQIRKTSHCRLTCVCPIPVSVHCCLVACTISRVAL